MSARAHIQDPLVGTRIDGRYLIHGVLGRGGMGVVYDGEHEQLGRPVAIKVLGPGVAGDPVAVQRFLREARTASRLTHGNIVDVSDLGTLPDGRPYLVMPKLQGVDLCTLLEKHGPQTPRRTCELLRGAAAALDLIHAKGFVHRDVKPENLMHVVHEDGSESVLLLDFGIVGLISPESSRLTAEGVVFGTPAYLSPEIIRGDTPGPSADVYALATVAFELITGSLPFSSPNVMQLMQLKLSQDAPRMSVAAGYEINADIEAAVLQSLSRDPKRRHPSAGTFIAALETAVQAETGALPPRPRLDTGARTRLENGSALELSLQDSLPAGSAASEAPTGSTRTASGTLPSQRIRAHGHELTSSDMELIQGTTDSTLPRARRPKAWRTRLASLVVLGVCLGGWLWSRPKPEPPPPAIPHVVTPLPAAPTLEETAPPPVDIPPTGKTPKPSAAPAGAPQRPTTTRAPTPQPTAAPKAAEPASVTPPQPSAAELIERAQGELVQGHLAVAADLYDKATRTDPRSSAAFRGLGLVQERLGKKPEAIRALRKAVNLAPTDPKNALLEARIRKLEGG